MQTTSGLYKQLLAEECHTFEIQILVGEEGSETVIGMDHIDSMRKTGAFTDTGGLTLGTFPSQELELTLLGVSSDAIPRMGRLRPQIRVVGADGVAVSEWIDIGVFFVDTRQKSGTVLGITAYDAARKADSQLTSTAISSTKSMYAVYLWGLCARQIGVSSVALPTVYQGARLLGSDELDVLRSTVGRMAGSFAGNAIISAANKLKLIDPSASPVAEIDEAFIETIGDPLDPVSRVVLQDSRHKVGDGVWSDTYGDETGTTVYIEGTRFEVPSGAMQYPQARRIWNQLHGCVYTPIIAENILLDPALELGDVVSSGDTSWMICSLDVEYGRLVVGTISAPPSSELEHEFPYKPIGDLTAECALRQALDAQEGLTGKLDTDLGNLPSPLSIGNGGTGQSVRYSAVTVTNDTSVATGHNITVRHFPYIGACFVRGMVRVTGVTVAANTWIDVATVPEEFRPAYTTSLAASKGEASGATAQIRNSSGLIRVASATALSSASEYYIYFSGWWLTA